MGQRVVFTNQKIRALFLDRALVSHNLKNFTALRNLYLIPKSTLEFYKAGKRTFSEETYRKLSSKFSEEDLKFFSKKIKYLDSNWGRKKGGETTYLKHQSIFDQGRKKAISIRRTRVHKFDIDISLNSKLAYFMGLFIGDGFTNKYGGYYLIQFTGDKKEELFYSTLFSDYCKELFDLSPKIRDDRISKAIRVNIYSVDLFNLITQRFKILAGRKSHSILIPEEILNSKPEIIKACLRGLYDAEGCVFFDKRKAYAKPYPRIELHMCNLELLKQVYIMLTKFGIKSILGESSKNLRVTIWGFEEVNKFVRKIGFMNPKQLKKLEFLKD